MSIKRIRLRFDDVNAAGYSKEFAEMFIEHLGGLEYSIELLTKIGKCKTCIIEYDIDKGDVISLVSKAIQNAS